MVYCDVTWGSSTASIWGSIFLVFHDANWSTMIWLQLPWFQAWDGEPQAAGWFTSWKIPEVDPLRRALFQESPIYAGLSNLVPLWLGVMGTRWYKDVQRISAKLQVAHEWPFAKDEFGQWLWESALIQQVHMVIFSQISSYRHLLVMTGYSCGTIHSINMVLFSAYNLKLINAP